MGRTGSVGDGELYGDSVVIPDEDVINAVGEICGDSVVAILDEDVINAVGLSVGVDGAILALSS